MLVSARLGSLKICQQGLSRTTWNGTSSESQEVLVSRENWDFYYCDRERVAAKQPLDHKREINKRREYWRRSLPLMIGRGTFEHLRDL